MIPVILSGGSGTRLWPLSRPLYPKQFLPLYSDRSLFQDTVERLLAAGLGDPLVVCNQEHRFLVAENMRALGRSPARIVLEPLGRNTAPAIAAAAMLAMQDHAEDPVLCVLPADHVIQDQDAFSAAMAQAEKLAQDGYLVTFGVTPTEPHTGYGYIEAGSSLSDAAYKIQGFKEKPDAKTAQEFLDSGRFYWNSGMFVFKASVYLAELEKFSPEIVRHARQSVDAAKPDLDFLRLEEASFAQCPDISIDYAVMEKTDKGAVLRLDARWCDVGSWGALWSVLDKDAGGNVCKGDVLAEDCRNSYFYSEDKLLCALGVEDLVVVDTKDALLVASRDRAQEIKNVVDRLKARGRSEATHHRVVYRPWGHYDSICHGERDQVKRITVKPGAKLSLQMHHHRAEHWVVVKGTALVTKGEQKLTISENESVYLPLGVVHALENPGKIDLEIIEVQTGSYLGEDDIVRFEDIYGRVK